MRKSTLLMLSLLLAFCANAQIQRSQIPQKFQSTPAPTRKISLEDLKIQNLNARGGERLKDVQSLVMDATMQLPFGDIPIKFYVKNGVGYRQEFEAMGAQNYMMLNEKEGWMFLPVQRMVKPEKMSEEMYNAMKSNMNLMGELFDKNPEIKYEIAPTTEKINGSDCYKVTATLDKKKVVYYYDVNTLLKSREVREGKDGELTTDYMGYFQTPEGFKFPNMLKTNMGDINVQTFQVNGDAPDELFQNH